MVDTSVFQASLKALNPEQLQAATTIEGPVMVLAGPGTGKTELLAARMAYILSQTDTTPGQLLALTFTEAAAINLRRRLYKLIGAAAYDSTVGTFHGFCQSILQEFPDSFPEIATASPLSDLERAEVISTLFEEVPLQLLRPLGKPDLYLTKVADRISSLKREAVSPDRYQEILAADQADLLSQDLSPGRLQAEQTKLAKQQELAALYRAYQDSLLQRQRYDYDDMITLVAQRLPESPELLSQLQERYLYVMVDEYQDANSAQNRVVETLLSYWQEAANLCVVGDPHQSIFRFQGASLSNTMSFLTRYPQATVISLTTGYRCPPQIYQAAKRLIDHNPQLSAQLAQPALVPAQPRPGFIKLWVVATNLIQTQGVTAYLQKYLADHPTHTAALLVPTNDQVVAWHQVLAQHHLPHHSLLQRDALEDQLVQQVLALLRVVRAYQLGEESPELFDVLCFPWLSAQPTLAIQLQRQAHQHHHTLREVLNNATDPEAQTLDELFKTLASTEPTQHLVQWIAHLFIRTGLLTWLTADSQRLEAHLPALKRWYEFVQQEAQAESPSSAWRLPEVLAAMTDLSRHRVRLSLASDGPASETPRVTVSTIHKAKGMEWDLILIPDATDKNWGKDRQTDILKLSQSVVPFAEESQDEREEKRRLFYVAITRARHEVMCSYPEVVISSTKSTEQLASLFLQELGELNKAEIPSLEPYSSTSLLPAPAAVSWQHSDVKSLAADLLRDFTLSPSALDTYLRDPQTFWLDYVLRVPSVKEDFMAYGTAVHAALEKWYQVWLTEGRHPELAFVLAHFETTLKKAVLSPRELAGRLAEGHEQLTYYYQLRSTENPAIVYTEKKFGSKVVPLMLDDIPLAGKIDRLEWLDDDHRTVKVIDYKTGTPKPKSWIIGTQLDQEASDRERQLPETIRSRYQRQLLFYKLLAELDPRFTYPVVVGQIEFIKPTKSGKLTSHSLDLTDTALTDLKDLIRQVMQEIRDLKFLD